MGTFGDAQPLPGAAPAQRKKPLWASLWVQVLVAIAIAIALGHFYPARGIAMKPLGDAFIRLISMIISLVIFCTVVTGIAGMENLKKVGRVGGKALLYFEVVSTLALLIGLVVGNVVHPGSGFNVNAATLDAKAVADYAGQAKAQSVTDFLMHIIPNTVTDAFSKGDILQVLLVSLLFGFAMSAIGPRCKPLVDVIDGLARVVFGVINILMRLAPIGAFGAMAFTVGKYGLASLGPLAKLILTFYATCFVFVFVILGAIAWMAGFSIIRFLLFIKEEILLVLAISSSEPALPLLLLAGPGWPGGADWLYIQYRSFEPVHDAGGAVRRAGDQHPPDTGPTVDYFCRGAADVEGCERRAGRFVYCAGGHADGDPVNSSGGHGADPGNRPVHEHVPRNSEYDWERRGHGGGGAMGTRARPRHAAKESRLNAVARESR